jgi:hypothetical protein
MPLLLVTSLDTHWTCSYTCIVLQWICGLCGIIDWLLYPVLIGWNVVQILGLVHLVMTINVLIIPLSRPHSAYLYWKARIWNSVSSPETCLVGRIKQPDFSSWRGSACKVTELLKNRSGQFNGNSLALRKSRTECQKAFWDIIIIIWMGIKNQDLSKWVKNE